ncbi:Gfo/Idh/MocA family protein [Schlesneria paludicola]|uniref:Gfo/Idh/MocA family protein n=1 Tax=Schlesneria paludicola TaxID=360056 RepID=UPI00138ACABD|nr:Gfo/Idh/MocA family oxidoreductase [Schlesneria paludicola]
MKPIQVALIGSGFMGRTYAECLKRYVQGATLAAVHGGSRAAQLAHDYDVELIETFPELLARAEIDAVLIATPQGLHCQQVIWAAQSGKHALVEKPMALDREECAAMIKACRDARTVLSVIQTWRFRGTVARAKKLLDDGVIGEPRMIQLRTLFPKLNLAAKEWIKQSESGGMILDQGAHNFDFLRYFAGSEATRIFGRVVDFSHATYPFPSAMAQLEFQNGVLAQTWMSFELPSPGVSNSAFRGLVVGSRGMLDIDGYGQLNLAQDGQPWETVWEQPAIDFQKAPLAPQRLEAFFTQVQDFVDSIRDQRLPSVTGEDGAAAISLIDAVRRSSQTGLAIELNRPAIQDG